MPLAAICGGDNGVSALADGSTAIGIDDGIFGCLGAGGATSAANVPVAVMTYP
jgi:hypothetical protein